jgi:DNA-binding transcriptional regulator/RsmH inhibitor MraZ
VSAADEARAALRRGCEEREREIDRLGRVSEADRIAVEAAFEKVMFAVGMAMGGEQWGAETWTEVAQQIAAIEGALDGVRDLLRAYRRRAA